MLVALNVVDLATSAADARIDTWDGSGAKLQKLLRTALGDARLGLMPQVESGL